MIDPQAVDLAGANQLKQQPVGVLKHPQVLDPQAGEVVHIEKAPIVDVIGCDTPGGQPVRLHFEQLVEGVECLAVARRARETLHDALDCFTDGWFIVAQRDEPTLQVLLCFMPLRDLLLGGIVAVRQDAKPRRRFSSSPL